MNLIAPRLYVILDRKSQKGRSFLETAELAINGGADVIQLRDKEAATREFIKEGTSLRELTRRRGVLLIVNDRVEAAAALNADGVHLGQDDLPIEAARKILGHGKIIGKSTHSLEQALEAEREGADYIGVGPVFATPTKPLYPAVGLGLVSEVSRRIKIPFVAIGGVGLENIRQVLDSGAVNIAVVRSVVGAEDIEQSARELKKIILWE
ncbi:MAG: thiamine phosphate synthase [Candidatus Omnitrophica bacterium]|nr:thiamine phosphate synthase [Candidatus Omnitrophota bacterium]